MKILVVIPTVFGGGAEQVAAILSRQWSRSHELRVFAWQSVGESLDFGVPVQFLDLGVQGGLGRKLGNVWARVCAVSRAMREFRPDVVMAFMDEAGMPCVLAAAWQGGLSRLVVSVHHNPHWMPRWRRALLRLFYRFPAAVVAVSEGVRAELARALCLPASLLQHIPNPLIVGASTVDAASQSIADEVCQDMPNGYILAVGRLDRDTKGLDLLVAAYAKLPHPRPGLVIVGEGADRHLIEADIQAARLGKEVRLTGWVKDPRPFYRAASVFVLASRYEGWSNVLMEAMGEGCPVVATRCPYGPAEILGEALAQCLVPPNDVPALVSGMQSVLAMDASERELLTIALRERAQIFTADRIAERWIDLALSLRGEAVR